MSVGKVQWLSARLTNPLEWVAFLRCGPTPISMPDRQRCDTFCDCNPNVCVQYSAIHYRTNHVNQCLVVIVKHQHDGTLEITCGRNKVMGSAASRHIPYCRARFSERDSLPPRSVPLPPRLNIGPPQPAKRFCLTFT